MLFRGTLPEARRTRFLAEPAGGRLSVMVLSEPVGATGGFKTPLAPASLGTVPSAEVGGVLGRATPLRAGPDFP